MAKEHVLRKSVIEETPSTADDGLSLASHVVRKSKARREVVEVFAIELTGGIVASAVGGIEGVKQAILLARHSEIIPAHAVVQGKTSSGAEAILNKEAIAVLESVPSGIAGDLVASVGNTLQKARQVREAQEYRGNCDRLPA